MPYDANNPPEKLRGLPEKTQRQWVHVYDSCMSKHGDDIKCNKMAWGVTGGWKEKGLDPNDPDRDVLLEIEILSDFKDKELEEKFNASLEEIITEKDIKDGLVSSKLGFAVELDEPTE